MTDLQPGSPVAVYRFFPTTSYELPFGVVLERTPDTLRIAFVHTYTAYDPYKPEMMVRSPNWGRLTSMRATFTLRNGLWEKNIGEGGYIYAYRYASH
jgi:hypothetical protein